MISFQGVCASFRASEYRHIQETIDYFNDKYNKGGSVVECYDVLAKKVHKHFNYESAEVTKAALIDSDLGSIDMWRKMSLDPAYSDNTEWANRVNILEENKQYREAHDWAQTIDISAPWVLDQYTDDFEGFTAYTAKPAYYSGGKIKESTSSGFQCRVHEDGNKELTFQWSVTDAIATPSSSVEFKVIMGKTRKTMKSKLYGNSYRSGYVYGSGVREIADFLILGESEVKFRVSGNTSYVDRTIQPATKIDAIKKVVAACQ